MMRLHTYDPPLVIEQLVFEINPELQGRWLELDHQIWTSLLAGCDGFAGKETWIDPDRSGEITLVIYWTSLACWQSIDPGLLAKTQAAFDLAIGEGNSRLVRLAHKEQQLYKLNEVVL
jgi:uncharacterized protein (TIGR03792 family)